MSADRDGRDEHSPMRLSADVMVDYRGLVHSLGSQLITLGHGGDQLDPLGPGGPHLRNNTGGGQ